VELLKLKTGAVQSFAAKVFGTRSDSVKCQVRQCRGLGWIQA
jgi:hypothetical protein